MKQLLALVYRLTVWAPGAVPLSEGEMAATLKRVILPLYDLVLIFASTLAIVGGLPSFILIYGEEPALVAAWMLLVSSTTCLIGVSFPRLWLVEALSKITLVGLLVAYAVALFVLAATLGQHRGFVGAMCLAACILPAWRLSILGRERRRRKLEAVA